MKYMNSSAKKIIYMAGPIHLFWTTGVFYVLGLCSEFSILIIVPFEYKKNEKFLSFIKQVNAEVRYLPVKKGIFKHFSYKIFFKKILKDWKPDAILIHNRFYVESLYMLYWCRRILKNCIRISYQDGRMTFNWSFDFSARLACDANLLQSKYAFVPRWAVKYVTIINYRVAYMLNIIVYPILVNGVRFSPMIDVWSGRIFKKRQSVNFEIHADLMLAYEEKEICQWEKLCGSRPTKIIHPLRVMGSKKLADLYGDEGEAVQILILPSYGFATSMIENDSFSHGNVVDTLSNKWIAVLNILRRTYPGKTIGMKLHPGAQLDESWAEISRRILNAIDGLIIFSPQILAEKLMIRSEIVLGDVSTCLYWATMLGDKTVISLDIFEYEGGDEMKNYSGIRYISNLEDIAKLNCVEQRGRDSACEVEMTVNEFMRDAIDN